jgi:hypothetical protein
MKKIVIPIMVAVFLGAFAASTQSALANAMCIPRAKVYTEYDSEGIWSCGETTDILCTTTSICFLEVPL